MNFQGNFHMELVDVIDDQGWTVDTVAREEIRRRRLPHRCVYILVFNRRGELFVHLRTPTKDVYPGYWDVAIGGVLAAGEPFDEGAVREGQEELGVPIEPEPLFPFRYEVAATVVQAIVYRAIPDGPFHLQAEEIVRGEFVPVPEVTIRAKTEKFCPDGLAALAQYQEKIADFRLKIAD